MSEKEYWDTLKVGVVGAGAVGSTFCCALAQRGFVDEIVLLDKNQALAEGQALDLAHSLPFFPHVMIYAGNTNSYANAQKIVIAAADGGYMLYKIM